MGKRVFFTMIGVGAGVVLGGYAVRKAERTRRRLAPNALVAAAGQRVDSLRDRVARAIEVGRAAAAEREAELRTAYGIDKPPSQR
jgi:hypothetical protein